MCVLRARTFEFTYSHAHVQTLPHINYTCVQGAYVSDRDKRTVVVVLTAVGPNDNYRRSTRTPFMRDDDAHVKRRTDERKW